SLNLKPVYLKDMLTKSLNLLKEQIDHKKLYVKVDVEPNLLIKVDETSFVNTVLNNLLTNAIKFSYESGDIEIRTSKGNKPNKLLLELKDYGIGIPQKLLQDIFDPTKKTHRPGTWQEKGTGFGMPLVKNLMEAYGGEVQLDSRSIEEHPESHGTSVFLHLEVDSLYK
ncbi:MAG: ATP-binding protein, partial [Leptospiraceae bacterium]|nr:ATP-binding protein [Leptospiraceae bacterium]